MNKIQNEALSYFFKEIVENEIEIFSVQKIYAYNFWIHRLSHNSDIYNIINSLKIKVFLMNKGISSFTFLEDDRLIVFEQKEDKEYLINTFNEDCKNEEYIKIFGEAFNVLKEGLLNDKNNETLLKLRKRKL